MTRSRFTWLVVLTQDCDLDLDRHARHGTSLVPDGNPVGEDKQLRTILLCPAYPLDEVLAGTYLRPFKARAWPGREKNILLENHHERYHVLKPDNILLNEELALDFKMLIGAPPTYLERWNRYHPESRVAVLVPPYRDHLTQRFAYYSMRVALP